MAELGAEDTEQLSTATGLHQVLCLAQAVGPSPGLLQAACSQLGALKIVVQHEDQTLQLPMAGGVLAWLTPDTPQQSQLALVSPTNRTLVGRIPLQQLRNVSREAAAQTGALLHIAHVLRLQPLIDALHTFVSSAATAPGSLLFGVLQLMFSDAVLDAVLGSSTISKYTYISSVLTQPCSFTPGLPGHLGLFKPAGPISLSEESNSIVFDAYLMGELMGASKGDRVHVELALFGGGGHPYGVLEFSSNSSLLHVPAQVLLGMPCSAADTAGFDLLMKSNLPP